MRILVVDDHAVVRQGVKEILRESFPGSQVDEAGDGGEALEMATRDSYDLVIADISLPGRGGIDLLRDLKSRSPRVPVLMLTMHPEEVFAIRALTLGADGYLTKSSAPEELVEAIRKIRQGGRHITSTIAERLVLGLRFDFQKEPHELLSDREYQVMVMIASGRTPRQIADELVLSPKTVSTYRARILVKMNLNNNAEITCYAIRRDLVE